MNTFLLMLIGVPLPPRRCGAAPARAIAELTSARGGAGSMKHPDKIWVSPADPLLCHLRRRLISTRSSHAAAATKPELTGTGNSFTGVTGLREWP